MKEVDKCYSEIMEYLQSHRINLQTPKEREVEYKQILSNYVRVESINSYIEKFDAAMEQVADFRSSLTKAVAKNKYLEDEVYNLRVQLGELPNE